MRCLVIGGTGWVGCQIALTLHAAGHEVVVASRGMSNGFASQLSQRVKRLKGDKTHPADVARWFDVSYDAVFDSVPQVASIRCLFEHRDKLGHYLHCSSTGGYAPLPYVPGDESLPYSPFLGGWTQKHEADTLALSLHREHGFPTTVLRPTCIIGPGLLPLDNFGGRREDFLFDLLQGRPITLPEAGQALLQPVHVVDLAEGFRLAAAQREQAVGQVFIITQRTAITLQRYVELIAAVLGINPNLRFATIDSILADGGKNICERSLRFLATHMCFSNAKAQRTLGYTPRFSAEAAVVETVQWAARQLALCIPTS